MIRNVLVVCTGNIYRSPIAEALFSAALPECEVRSAGLRAAVDFAVPPALKALFAARRLSRTSWSPWQLGRSDVLKADLLLVMEAAQKREVESSFPAGAGKTFLLGEPLGQDIADPHGGDGDVLNQCYAQIESCIHPWVRRISAVNGNRDHG